MKYTIHGFSQKVAIEMGLKSDELLLLRWFVEFIGTNKMRKFFIGNECFYWVHYDAILEDLPILDCKKRAVASKFKNLVEADVLKNLTVKQGGTYSVYAISGNYERLISDTGGCCSNDNGVAVETTTGLLFEQQRVAVETTTGCCSNDNGVAVLTTTKDLITINPITNLITKTNIEENECFSENEKTSEQEIFDYWNIKEGVVKNQEKSFHQNKIATAIKKYGKENILKAIDRLNAAVMDSKYYYNNRWNLYNFLTQANGISNWLDDGQIWNNYNSNCNGENKKPATKKNGFVNFQQHEPGYYEEFEKLEQHQRACEKFDPDELEKLRNGIGRNIDGIS